MDFILETYNLTKKYGGLIANNNITLKIPKGKTTGLIGPNGSGKTTFINQISGLLKPTEGRIIFKNIDITGLPAYKISNLGIARTYQRIQLFDHLTVLENVLVARKKYFKSNIIDIILRSSKLLNDEKQNIEITMKLLSMLDLEKDANKLPSSLPYGKRRRLEIARALAIEPSLILLDEPAAGMTKEEFKEILHIMSILKENKVTILLVEHTMEFIRQAVDTLYVLNFGEIIASGTFEEIENNPTVISAYLGD